MRTNRSTEYATHTFLTIFGASSQSGSLPGVTTSTNGTLLTLRTMNGLKYNAQPLRGPIQQLLQMPLRLTLHQLRALPMHQKSRSEYFQLRVQASIILTAGPKINAKLPPRSRNKKHIHTGLCLPTHPSGCFGSQT